MASANGDDLLAQRKEGQPLDWATFIGIAQAERASLVVLDLNARTGFFINDIGADKAVGIVGNGGTCGTGFPLGVYSAWLFDIRPEIVVPTGEPFTVSNVGGQGMVTAMESLSDIMLTTQSTFHWVALSMVAVNVFVDVAPDTGHVTYSL